MKKQTSVCRSRKNYVYTYLEFLAVFSVNCSLDKPKLTSRVGFELETFSQTFKSFKIAAAPLFAQTHHWHVLSATLQSPKNSAKSVEV